MSHTIFVPTTVNVKDPLPIADLDRALTDTIGLLGAPQTVPDAHGGWFSEEHGLIREPVYPITGEADEAAVIAHARELAKRLGQEAIMVSTGDRARFVAAEPHADYPEAPRKVTLHLPGVKGGKLDDAAKKLSEWFGGYTYYPQTERLVAHASHEALLQHGPKVFALAHHLGGTAK